MPSIFVRIWLESEPSNNTWFSGFAVLGGTSFLCSMAMLTLFMLELVPTSAESLHWMLVDRVMRPTYLNKSVPVALALRSEAHAWIQMNMSALEQMPP
ncbi:hypothetical protein QQS21_001367 [Conoideocrella luteorostrata]|uniref:Uncharacterized protein n=1 Tax=Conoideocrella luteorostrata TaxID=1105319 RepID=A0AAJ0CX80_9HYPO|nr:hypothetical protein QQS21_001367 [Conoideocrella luteorostrata]